MTKPHQEDQVEPFFITEDVAAELTAITLPDCEAMRDGFGRCSELLHSPAAALNRPLPRPEVLTVEIDALASPLHARSSRQQQTVATRRGEEPARQRLQGAMSEAGAEHFRMPRLHAAWRALPLGDQPVRRPAGRMGYYLLSIPGHPIVRYHQGKVF